MRRQQLGAQIRRHDDDRVAEIHRAALAVGEAAIVEKLQQNIENVGMGLFHLIEQDDLVGPATHGLGENAAFLIADIARRRAEQAGDRVLLQVFRHVDAEKRAFIVEHEFRQGFRQLGLADTGGAEEEERTDRPVAVLETGAGTANGVADGNDGLFSTGIPLQRATTEAICCSPTASFSMRSCSPLSSSASLRSNSGITP